MSGERILVTGAAGLTGRAVVTDLLGHGYTVLGTDVAPHPPGLPAPFSRPDFTYTRDELTDYGEVLQLVGGVDAVIHLANIPMPTVATDARTLQANTTMNGNMFLAAADRKVRTVVWASSETTLGLDFSPENPPEYAPIDEEHYPHPTTAYSLSKEIAETTAHRINEWSGIPFLALRLSQVTAPERYPAFRESFGDTSARMYNLWSYVDVRDCAWAFRLALLADVPGAEAFLIAAADTAIDRPTADLMAEAFPTVPIRTTGGTFDSLYDLGKAARMLDFRPQHSWRDATQAPNSTSGTEPTR